MSRKPVTPTNVYPYKQMAPHVPTEQYNATAMCQCGHGHMPATVQNITVKQTDPFVRYMAMGLAGACIGLLVLASVVATLIAAGLCALCVAVATWAVRAMLNSRDGGKKP
ncbi:hypothetical protein ABZV52_29900 [Streptomyces sp. NPDC004735]|uniref:hypothetical protein n=1 Tax=Streptomyces TaxID=1883 RepID=UPI0033BC6F45